jgi:hypothetical protein
MEKIKLGGGGGGFRNKKKFFHGEAQCLKWVGG